MRRTGEHELSGAVGLLLAALRDDGFIAYCCGPKDGPTALVAAYEWPDYVDVVTIRDFDAHIAAARAPLDGPVDVFALEEAVWSYQGPAEATLRALLDLPHPDHPDSPRVVFPAPESLRVPRAEQRPMTIKLADPDRAGRRAARLAAKLGNAELSARAVPAESR